MKSRQNAALYANPFLLWGTLGVKAMQMSAAAAQVIAIRTTRMATHGLNPNAADRREMTLMGAEKVDAFSRAGQALATGALPLVAGMAGQARSAPASTCSTPARTWPRAEPSRRRWRASASSPTR